VLTGRLVAIPKDHIDTDQIIPARFLKTISKAGLGQNLFADWRYDGEGQPVADFPLPLEQSFYNSYKSTWNSSRNAIR